MSSQLNRQDKVKLTMSSYKSCSPHTSPIVSQAGFDEASRASQHGRVVEPSKHGMSWCDDAGDKQARAREWLACRPPAWPVGRAQIVASENRCMYRSALSQSHARSPHYKGRRSSRAPYPSLSPLIYPYRTAKLLPVHVCSIAPCGPRFFVARAVHLLTNHIPFTGKRTSIL
jgi:hypothetical protein